VFIFHAEDNPDSTPSDFRQSDSKRHPSAMLKIMGIYCIKNPVESKDRVKGHCKVIPVSIFVSTNIAEETFGGVGLKEGPIHEKVPYRYRYSIDGCKSDENCKIFPSPVDSVHAESGIVQYRREIFATVDEMRKYVLSIIVTTNALQCAPDSRKR
ncbi:hypothetical protein NA56DRAFT_586445, partial [Hyaloscypha hepaticicola]